MKHSHSYQAMPSETLQIKSKDKNLIMELKK